jgi:TonB family protein
MRTLTLLLSLAAASAFAATPTQTLGARSAHHQLHVERTAVSADRVVYNVAVDDLDSGAVVLNQRVEGRPRQPLDISGGVGTKRVHVHLADTEHFFTAAVAVTEDNTIVDEFRTWWQLEPRTPGATAQSEDPVPLLKAPGAYRVGGDVKPPVVIRKANPFYPDSARRNNVMGIVILEVLVGKDGRVKETAVRKGLPEGLSQAAIDAVRQWEFKPGTLNGEPVDVIFNLTINFRL